MSATAASRATGGYVPPFARTTTAAAGSTGTSISFANIASRTAGTGTATSSAVIVDSTGGVDSSSLLEYFTKPYIDAHSLSIPSYRYAYILWFVIVGTLIVWSIAYQLSGTGTGGSSLGAWFRKWSIRRITWTKRVGGGGSRVSKESSKLQEEGRGTQTTRKKVVWASPTFAQLITVLVLIGSALCLTFIGDDYIAPTTCTFGGYCGYQSYYGSSGPPKTTYRAKRALSPLVQYSSFASDIDKTAPAPVPAPLGFQQLTQPVKRGNLNPNGWAPFNDPLLASSNINIAKSAWTTAARLGLISFAMLPLAVTLALKQWPFNIWATPWLTNYHFDKTAILHRWSGRVIWAFSTGHAIAWFYELAVDKDPFGRGVIVPVWSWYRFVAGAVAWVVLTIIVLFSLSPIRNRFYEFFYWSHVGLLLLFFAAAILHHRPVMYFPIAAVAWWGAERLVRFIVFLWINGFAKGIWFKEPASSTNRSSGQSFGLVGHEKGDYVEDKASTAYPPMPYDEAAEPFASHPMQSRQSSFTAHYPPPSPSIATRTTPTRSTPPPGFAAAQLLPGRTIRLTLNAPSTLRWAPGQHLLLNIPSVRFFDSHPYTIASIDHRAKGVAPVGTGSKGIAKGSEIIMLVRAQKGFSKALWDHVVKIRRERELRGAAASEVAKGVNLRALVSWPMGSAGRVEWGAYESLTIIAGGTGITFGVSVLENACTRLARKMEDPKWKTTRVRFVWILKEFAHLSWVATTLRRCLEMCDSSQLQIDLFVTNDTPRSSRRRNRPQADLYAAGSTDDLAPPTAPFARNARTGSPSRDSLMSEASDWSDTEGSPTQSRQFTQMPDYGDNVDSVTDLVLFDGEEEERTPAELEVSAKLKKEGKLRRALSRRGGNAAKDRRSSSAAPLATERPVQQLYDQQDSFEALPLDHNDPSPHYPYSSRSPSNGDLGYHGSPSMHFDDHSDVHTVGDAASTRHLFGGRSQRNSVADLPDSSPRPSSAANDDFFLDVTEAEQEDLDFVAELARPGYPRLKQILDDEVHRSVGKTIVACCGPSSLNTLVRNLVSSRIDLKKVARGDPRGQVSIVVEDFSF